MYFLTAFLLILLITAINFSAYFLIRNIDASDFYNFFEDEEMKEDNSVDSN